MAFTILLEEREFPSDRAINTRTEEFEPEVMESRDAAGRVLWRRVEPYRLSVNPFITEFDEGLGVPPPGGSGPIPSPWGPGEPIDVRFYSYMFTIWHQDFMRELTRTFSPPFPLHFVAYYVARESRVNANTVHAHAVSLRTLRVLGVSPASGSPDGIVSTAAGEQRVVALSPLRGLGSSEGIGGAHFVEWSAWTVPPATITPRATGARGLTTTHRRMTLVRNTSGRAVAFYKPFPEPPSREPEPEEQLRVEPPFEDYIREVLQNGDLAAVRKAIQEIDERVRTLGQLQELLKRRLGPNN